MNSIRLIPVLVSIILLASCSHTPTPMPDGKGGVAYATQVGGKGMLTYNADGSMSHTYDNEISFQHLMQTASVLGLSYIEMLRYAEQMLTDRFLAGEITKREFNAGMFQLKELGVKAELSGEAIGAKVPGFQYPQL
jgi:hypothetical protein